MLRFTLLGFPVTIHWMFWLVAFLLSGGGGDPKALLLWIFALFISILWHELGHAFAYKHYGATPSITLYGMGGLCYGHGYSPRKDWRREQIIISLAGPAFGLIFAALAWLVLRKLEGPPDQPKMILTESMQYLHRFTRNMWWINGFWTLVNLLPVIPLDGGRVMEAIMGRGTEARKRTHLIAIVAAVGAAIFGFRIGQPFMALLFGYLAYQNYMSMSGKSAPNILGGQR